MDFTKLKEKVKSIPMLYVIATANSDGDNADVVLQKGNWSLDMFSMRNKRPIEMSKNALLNARGNFTCLCPFHSDTQLNSFVVTHKPSGNIWKCFVCDSGYDNIHFEMKFYNLQFKDAVYHLAKRMGLLDGSFEAKNSSVGYKKKQLVEEKMAGPYTIDLVYKTMRDLYPLSKEDREHLLVKRHLTEEDLVDYFTFPSEETNVPKEVFLHLLRKSVIQKYGEEALSDEIIVKETQKKFAKFLDDFKYIPGFYFDEKNNAIKWVPQDGIGLLTSNAFGLVKGIQVQNRTPENGKPKYKFWSSSFKLGEPYTKGGSSCGAVSGVIYPKNGNDTRKADIVITEGKYKAEAFAKQGLIAIYVTGVSSWRSIMDDLDFFIKDKERKRVFIAFDADSAGNTAVYKQLKALSEELINEKGLSVISLHWRKKYGKGFDDLIETQGNEYKRKISGYKFHNLELVHEQSLSQAFKAFNVEKITDLKDKEVIKKFQNYLQQCIEDNLELPK